jgi:hypothetical protein
MRNISSRLGALTTIVCVTTLGAAVLAGQAASARPVSRIAATPAGRATQARHRDPLWDVEPGGFITGTSQNVTLTDTSTGIGLTGRGMKHGPVSPGPGQLGTDLIPFTSVTFTGISDGFTVTTSASPSTPWMFNAVSYQSGVVSGTVTGIRATLSGPSCSATVDGTSATGNDGQVNVTYTNSTGTIQVLTAGGNLHLYDVSGCTGLLNDGDPVTFSASYAISPTQTITPDPPRKSHRM